MTFEMPLYADIAVPVAFLIAGLAVGIIAEKVILVRLSQLAATTGREGIAVATAALRGLTTLACFLAGAYAAVRSSPLPEAIAQALATTLIIGIISIATLAVARLAGNFLTLYAAKTEGLFPEISIFSNLARLAIIVVGLLVILQYLQIPITPLLTALGVGGLAVALALQDTLSNLFAGLFVIASRQIRPGDYVRLESGEEGYVQDITWRNTIVRTLPNNVIVVPNAKLGSMVFTNYHLPDSELSILIQVGVSYNSDLARVEQVTLEVAGEVLREVEGGEPGFEPVVRYHTLGDYSINFNVVLRGREFVAQFPIKHEFIKRLHRRYQQEGITIPYPIRTVYLNDRADSPELPGAE